MECPICGSNMKPMYKPEIQWHCRGFCGLIIKCEEKYSMQIEEKILNRIGNTAITKEEE